jgi:hypothetical protein
MTYMDLTFEEEFFGGLGLPRISGLRPDNSFLHYAVKYCLVHARGEAETEIPDQILGFLRNCSGWRKVWNRYWYNQSGQLPPDKLQIAMAFRLEVISRHIRRRDGPGKSLQIAVSQGDTYAVGFLLENGVRMEDDGSLLLEAVINGHATIVGVLLAHCSPKNSWDCNRSSRQGNEPMQANESEVAGTPNYYTTPRTLSASAAVLSRYAAKMHKSSCPVTL